MNNFPIEVGHIYRHYKIGCEIGVDLTDLNYKRNTLYKIVSIALMCSENNTTWEPLVIYRELDGDLTFCRPLSNFLAFVKYGDNIVPRFSLISRGETK